MRNINFWALGLLLALAAAVPWQPAVMVNHWFYEKEITDARAKLKDAVKKELEADKTLVAAGKIPQARDALDLILFYKGDPELVKQMADLKTLADHPLKLSPKLSALPAPVSAVNAAPATAK